MEASQSHTEATERRQAPSPIRIFMSTGDVSGDLHGALLAEALHRAGSRHGEILEVFGIGGERMRDAGVDLVGDTDGLSAVGVTESLPFILPTLRIQWRARRALRRCPPDVAILIDYPTVNIPLGASLRRKGLSVQYYIPPNEWFWTTKGNRLLDRTPRVVRSADRFLAVHPVEAAFYEERGARVEMVGHPLQDRVEGTRLSRDEARAALGITDETRLVALLPASRPQEVRLIWPVMAETAALMAEQLEELRFVVPLAAESMRGAMVAAIESARRRFPALRERLELVDRDGDVAGASALVFAAADLGITKSGTANLELALHDIPQVSVYMLGRLTEWLGRHLLGLSEPDFVNASLVNHIMDREIVPEFTQYDALPDAIAASAIRLLVDDSKRDRMLDSYCEMRRGLGGPGAVDRVAELILSDVLDQRGIDHRDQS